MRKFAVVKKLWLEVFLMVAHYGCFALGLHAAGASAAQAACYYATGYAFQGIYLGFFFGLRYAQKKSERLRASGRRAAVRRERQKKHT